jgi:hypothetical protein
VQAGPPAPVAATMTASERTRALIEGCLPLASRCFPVRARCEHPGRTARS